MGLDIGQVQQLTRDAREFGQQRQQEDLFAALRTMAEALEEPVDRLEVVSLSLADTPLGRSEVSTDATGVREALEACAAFLGDAWNPRSLHESKALRELKEAVSRLADDLEEQGSRAWRTYLEEHPIPKVGELAELLRQIGIEGLTRELLAIQNAVNRLVRTSKVRFPSPEAFKRFEEDLAKARQGASRIGLSEALPPAVTAFLREVAEQGADLESFTPEVASWIEERNLGRTFVIVARSS